MKYITSSTTNIFQSISILKYFSQMTYLVGERCPAQPAGQVARGEGHEVEGGEGGGDEGGQRG